MRSGTLIIHALIRQDLEKEEFLLEMIYWKMKF